MNTLEKYIFDNGLDEIEVMSRVQGESNLVSDLCVMAVDVPESDCPRVIGWLQVNDGY